MKKTELGAWGEDRAAEYLTDNGYRIVCRNFRCRMGEIDLIAQKEDILAFAEVKLRKNSWYGEAREFVTAEKQRKLRLARRLPGKLGKYIATANNALFLQTGEL